MRKEATATARLGCDMRLGDDRRLGIGDRRSSSLSLSLFPSASTSLPLPCFRSKMEKKKIPKTTSFWGLGGLGGLGGAKFELSNIIQEKKEREGFSSTQMAYASSCSMSTFVFNLPRTRRSSPIQTTRVWPSRFRCSAGQTEFFTKLGRLVKEKAKSDVDKLFSGFSKTHDNLAVIDELLLYWNLSDTDRVLDELEEDTVIGSETVKSNAVLSTESKKDSCKKTTQAMKEKQSRKQPWNTNKSALSVADFGPKITIKIVESLRDDIYARKLKSGSEIK
ncbi:unnamed protein product [Camellia sinensis]